MKKRIMKYLVLTFVLISCFIIAKEVRAEEVTGQCGDNVFYTLDTNTGVVAIGGEGSTYERGGDEKPFYNNTSIKKVVIEEGVTSLGNELFFGCKNLEEINLPSSLETIGVFCFYNSGLKKIEIPSSVISIGSYAFEKCLELKSAVFDEESNMTKLGDENKINIFANNPKLETVVLPRGLKILGKSVFWKCESLQQITIPNELEVIGERTFYQCTSLKKVIMQDCASDGLSIGTSAFYECKNLESVDPIKYCTTMGNNCFEKTGLVSVNLSSDLKEISDEAFYACAKLQNITIPEGVTYIGMSVFEDCTALEKVILPNSLEGIYTYSFRNSGIKEINIPGNVKKIYGPFLQQCKNIEKVTVSKDNKYYDSRNNCNGVIETKTNTLISGCKNTIIPLSVTSIGHEALSNTEYKKMVFEQGEPQLELIDVQAFAGSGLVNVVLPESLRIIKDFAFDYCINMESIYIPNGVVEMCSFDNCRKLTTLKIPFGITSINGSLFHECDLLKKVIIPSSVTDISKYVLKGLSVQYQGAKSYWDNNFMDLEGITSIEYINGDISVHDKYISLGNNEYSISNNSIVPALSVYYKDICLKDGRDYETVIEGSEAYIVGKGSFCGKKYIVGGYSEGDQAQNEVKKKKNPVSVKAKSIKVKRKTLKKKKVIIKKKKAFRISSNKYSIKFNKISGNKKIKISSSGIITIKKGLKKGKYIVVIKYTVGESKNYLKTVKRLKLKIIVR